MIVLLQEVDVPGRDDAHQLATHFSVVCDGDSTEAVPSLRLEDVSDAFIRAHHYGVCDETLFVTLGEGRESVCYKCYKLENANKNSRARDRIEQGDYLDFANFIGLELRSAVVMNEADPTC